MVKNLIFDLGGVILDLAVPRTLAGFSRLSGLTPEKVTELFRGAEGFLQFERGTISETEFRNFVRSLYNIKATDEQLDECWNAMLLSISYDKLQLLKKLKKTHRTYLLSNTNTIHLDFINTQVLPGLNGVKTLDDYFHQTYYSHLMGTRKPEAEIFGRVLQENSLDPAETLFLDDNADNIEGAKKLGIQTAFVNTPDFILEFFS